MKKHLYALFTLLLASPALPAAEASHDFKGEIKPLLEKFCIRCHGVKKQKGEVRLDILDPDIINGKDGEKWHAALDVINTADMPPDDVKQPSDAERRKIVDWMTGNLKLAKEKKRGEAKTVVRRLTKDQYNNSLQKLLGLSIDFSNTLPPEAKSHMGFTNAGESMTISPLHIEYYQKIARNALDKAIGPKEKPAVSKYRLDFAQNASKKVYAKIGGYQSINLDGKNYKISILDENDKVLTDNEIAPNGLKVEEIKKNIMVGFRGSDDRSRWGMVEDGMVMHGSVPHVEKAPKSWQGANPNLKMLIRKDFPSEGDFVFRVTASNSLPIPVSEFFLNKTNQKSKAHPTAGDGTQTFKAKDFRMIKNFKLDGNKLVADDRGSVSTANVQVNIPKDGYYHFNITRKPISEKEKKSNFAFNLNNYYILQHFHHKNEKNEGNVADVISIKGSENKKVNSLLIQIPGKKRTINLMELEIYGPKNKKIENALITMSSTYDDSMGPKTLMDGNKKNLTHTLLNKDNPWIKIEFNKPQIIESLKVYNRIGYEKRFYGAEFSYYQGQRLVLKRALDDNKHKPTLINSTVAFGKLKSGTYTLNLKANDFVEFHELSIIPASDKTGDIRAKENTYNKYLASKEKYKNISGSLQAFLGTRADDGMDHKLYDGSKAFNSPIGKSQTQVFKGRLENLPVPVINPNTKNPLANIMILGIYNDHLVKDKDLSGPPVKIERLEFEAPYIPQWPMLSYKNIFFDSKNKANKDLYTKEVISKFINRAFRKKVDAHTINIYYNFWKSIKAEFPRYEDGVKEALVAVLCSPEFLFMAEPKQESKGTPRVNEFQLANRLSYFLWNQPPDKRLLDLAYSFRLSTNLDKEIDRMVQDPKSDQFIETFSREWLRMDRLESISTDFKKYQNYNRFVKADMAKETRTFLTHVLKNNMSIENFIDSDFAMLNQNLAEFYGIKGVQGTNFRPVKLKPEYNRGGLITQASFLTGHSDGNQAHPIKRGVWLMEKLLDDEPPPPPPNVPALDADEPSFKGLTIKQQLELHREKSSCIDCHLKIDPWGVVFENYDAVGKFNAKADSKTELLDGTKLNGINELKKYIKENKQENVTRAVTKHLLAYSLGRDLSYMDNEDIDQIVHKTMEQKYGFKDLVKNIISHDIFTRR
ncbi:DUF1592 domain-containing protein [Lentisphaera profundi]|uniref:DUF1592 domain-containing protein n=1 Tax=Lentisphaera profundi TaxID=1658616 RepID=A0ABY7VTG6_9BACT|nr:DUF1592 domain-containing protein [Lentisphaera profundi]WDE97054.1 DUF1592 domain-containing protein [Lentisphaera profundi]